MFVFQFQFSSLNRIRNQLRSEDLFPFYKIQASQRLRLNKIKQPLEKEIGIEIGIFHIFHCDVIKWDIINDHTLKISGSTNMLKMLNAVI